MQPKKKNKFRHAIIVGVLLALTAPISAMAVNPGDVSRQALDLAGAQKFSEALNLLSSQDIETQVSYEIRFALARILAWDKQYDASAIAYDNLLIDYPGNPDIQNGYGYLEYYRGNYDKAEMLLNEVVVNYPGYADALKGIDRVRAARTDAARNESKWRIDVNGSTSSLSDGLPSWNSQSLRVEHVPGNIALHTAATRYERFGQNDIQVMAGIRSNTDKDWDWQLAAGYTPSADFRPETTGMARFGHKIDTGGITLHGSLGYQVDNFETAGTIHQVTPQVVAYLDNDIVLTGRLTHVMQNSESDKTGWLVSGSSPITGRLSGRLGYANAPEAINGEVITTQSVFGGLSYQLTDGLDIHATYSRDDRENSYKRDALNVGITQRY